MSRIYDNWARLVGATLKREEFRELARAPSLSSSSSCSSSRFSFSLSSPLDNHFPVNPEASSSSEVPFYGTDGGAESPSDSTPRSEDGILQLPMLINFKELKIATRGFQSGNILGEGGSARVFKGWVDPNSPAAAKLGSGMTVAIKKRHPNSREGFKEWLTEVDFLSQLRHPNLIKLIAYCNEGGSLGLVYEFMPQGSLNDHLFNRDYRCLSWAMRIKVAVGAARGLTFLHDAEEQVAHRHITSSNILLDEEYNAKLSSFAYAIELPSRYESVDLPVVGTLGYAAPEYITTGEFSEKCDVYGFGVVLLELISGRPAFVSKATDGTRYLVEWARPYLSKKKRVYRVMDAKLEGEYPQEGAFIVATLALQCVRNFPETRPRMAEVLATLERL